jgi:molybdenum cofactor cytidylyltransferase
VRLAAIVLAAGSSTRFGSDKLSALFQGKRLLDHAIAAARAAPVGEVLVVCRKDLALGEWPGEPPVCRVPISCAALSDSLKAGMAAAGQVDGAFVFLGDMPLVPPELAARLANRLGGNYAALPRHDGRPGHPVLLSARAFADVAGLAGDEGAGRLLRQRSDVVLVEWHDERIHLDIDRTADLARLEDSAGEDQPPSAP